MCFLGACFCVLLLAPLTLSSARRQPLGIHIPDPHKWCPLSETNKAVLEILRWLFRERRHGDEKVGDAETLTATVLSGLVTTVLPGRSGAELEGKDDRVSLVNRKDNGYQGWSPGTQRSPLLGIDLRTEYGFSTLGGGIPTRRRARRFRKWKFDNGSRKGGRNVGNWDTRQKIETIRNPTGKKNSNAEERWKGFVKQQQDWYLKKLTQVKEELRDELLSAVVSRMSNGDPSKKRKSDQPLQRKPDTLQEPESTIATPTSSMDASYPRMGMMIPLPQPNSPGAPRFIGKNISEFLKTWENLCEDYMVTPADRLRKLPRYCDRMISLYVETIPEYKEKN
jgi:hypothetical protein